MILNYRLEPKYYTHRSGPLNTVLALLFNVNSQCEDRRF